MVEKITSQKSVQPILSNILIETSTSDRVTFITTDLSLTISNKIKAEVNKEGSITINAKKLSEIITKLEEKPIKLITEEETNKTTIECGRSKFELIGIDAENYPKIVQEENEDSIKIEIDKITEGKINYILFDNHTELQEHYFSKDKTLFISEARLDGNKEFLWYLPEIKKQDFNLNITNLHPISSTEVAIFLPDEVY